jgi:dolichyl-phosphate beta-glucosyltransferase
VPAYNEERRIEHLLRALSEGLGESQLELLDVVIVDDGSVDRTPELLGEAAARDPRLVPIVTGGANEGKGAAIAAGVRKARGEFTLLCDVDVSTPLSDVAKLHRRLAEGADLAIGSRDVPGSVVEAPEYRKRIGRTFNFMVRRLTGLPFKDTQCGFKLMRTETAVALHEGQLVKGFASDVELLLKARRMGLTIAEVPVTYVHDDDSKVNPVTAAPRMAIDLIRLVYRLRRAPR